MAISSRANSPGNRPSHRPLSRTVTVVILRVSFFLFFYFLFSVFLLLCRHTILHIITFCRHIIAFRRWHFGVSPLYGASSREMFNIRRRETVIKREKTFSPLYAWFFLQTTGFIEFFFFFSLFSHFSPCTKRSSICHAVRITHDCIRRRFRIAFTSGTSKYRPCNLVRFLENGTDLLRTGNERNVFCTSSIRIYSCINLK